MILTLILKDSIHTTLIPQKPQGQHWITYSNDRNKSITKILMVDAVGEDWVLRSTKDAYIIDRNGGSLREAVLKGLNVYRLRILGTTDEALLYCEDSTEDRKSFFKVVCPESSIVLSIGRDFNNDIAYENRFVSSKHADLLFNGSAFAIRDKNSSNGTYLNGKRVTEALLKPGDTIFIIGLKIIIGKGFFSINDPDGRVSINNDSLTSYKKQNIVDRGTELGIEDSKSNDNIILFSRSPRFKKDFQTFEVNIDPPPPSPIQEQLPAILTIGPSATMGLASLAMASVTIVNLCLGKADALNSLPMLVMAVAMLAGTLLWPTIIKKYENKKRGAKEELRKNKYTAYINTLKNDIDKERSYQSEILNENYVSIDNCLSRIKLVQRNLWERTSIHNDFLTIRLGRGTIPLDYEIKCQPRKFSIEEDAMVDLQYKLAEEPQMLKDVPITLSLRDDRIVGIIGSRSDTVPFVKSILFQLVALHSYDEVKIVVICRNGDESWQFTRWLPHIWDDEHQIRFLAENSEELKTISFYLDRELSNRKSLHEFDKTSTPQYVIISLDHTIAERSEFMRHVYETKEYCGFSVIAAYDELKYLPKECSRIIELSKNRSRIYDRSDISGQLEDFTPEFFTDGHEEDYAAILANVRLDINAEQAKFPSMLTFNELFGVGRIEHLNIRSRWRESDPTKSLRAYLGVDEYGDRFELDIHQSADGPHGLVAGATGSGKSQFLMTYILSMAVNYSPEDVAFILIDFKGGDLANAFSKLPHTVGIITNLDGAEINRSLMSIDSELKRRQRQFNEANKQTGLTGIDIYSYQKLYHDGVLSEPMPHLIIISDEFAELKQQQPEFMEKLIQTARVGRSLGVHLILATQKPTGVVNEQILSNTRFRICLNVLSPEDSKEMLDSPIANGLPTGRFFIKLSDTDTLKQGQSAYAGAPYIPSDRVVEQRDNSLSILENTGKILSKSSMKLPTSSKQKSQLIALCKYISELSDEIGYKHRMLWRPPMNALITVDQLMQKYNITPDGDVCPVVGEYDIPEEQSQKALTIPFDSVGNVVVYGASGSGKTTFVNTLMSSLIGNYSPEQVNIYAVDFAAQSLSQFGGAPQVGDIVLQDEDEKIENLFKLLRDEVRNRRTTLREYGGDIATYNKLSGKIMPRIVVILHNYTSILESYDLEDEIALFTREGPKRGIHFALTAQSANAIRHKTLQNFGQIIVLKMNDPLDYSAILGNIGGVVPASFMGRGLIKLKNVYELQIAHCTLDDESTYIRALCTEARERYADSKVGGIPILPEKVDVNFLSSYIGSAEKGLVPVGVDREKLTVVSYPVLNMPLTWVLSDSGNCESFAQGLSEVLSQYSGVEVTVLDPKKNFISPSGYGYTYAGTVEDINREWDAYFQEMLRRNKLIKGDPSNVFTPSVVIVNSVEMLDQVLTEENRVNFYDALDNVLRAHRTCFVLCERGDYINHLAERPWINKNTTFKDALWLGNGLGDQFRLTVNKSTRSVRSDIEEGCGFVLLNGNAVCAKMLVPENYEMTEGEY